MFRAFMGLRQYIIIQEESPEIIKRLMDEFVHNEKVARLFPPEYMDEINKAYEEDPNSVTLRQFDRLHGFAICYFQDIFELAFRKTRSFYYIKNLFKDNELINKRLHMLNLISTR